ncbi:MAG: alpha/beta fold hydrolase [Proteobacteria bacterium]|nr:alpha/beta fold hydrolase [Pseudomonadota bacterium]
MDRNHRQACDIMDESILEVVIDIASQRLGVPSGQINVMDEFAGLGADSMTIYEINAAAADRYKVQDIIAEFSNESVCQLALQVEEAVTILVQMRGRGGPGSVEEEVIEQTVYYATNRQYDSTVKDLSQRYLGERSIDKSLDYGIAVVTIPASHKSGMLEGPFLGLKMLEDPQSHIILSSLEELGEKHFFEAIGNTLAQSAGGDWDGHAIIFIHGFNVPFTEAVIRTAQIAYDIEFTGAPMLFSWPSDGSLLGYTSDREDATWSVAYLRELLDKTVTKLAGKKIHIIAHSMGNQVLIGALQQMMLADNSRSQVFESITLAAPDFDAELFVDQIAPLVRDLTSHWTIYTSDNDMALSISLEVNSNRRLGQPVTPIAEYDVIDATGIEVSPWSVPENHSYYATKQQVIDDIQQAISGVSARDRGLSQKRKGGIVYYSLE